MKPLRPKYGQTIIYVVLLVVSFIAMTMTKRCTSISSLPEITQTKSSGDTIDVAILYGPTSYYLYSDTLGGINLDMLQAFEKETATPLKFWPIINLHDALSRLENGKYDMLASLPSDNSVKQRFLTTRSAFLDRMVLIQLSDTSGKTPIRSALDLSGKTIHIQQDSPAAMRISNLSKEIGDSIYVKNEPEMSEEYLCMLVATEKIPLAVVNEKTAKKMQSQYPRLSYDNPVSFTQFQVWLMNKNDTVLLHKVDKWLESFQSKPSYRNLIDKY